MAEPYVSLRGARLGYSHRIILEGVDVALAAGDFLGIVGPNGSGKTTLLKSLLGIQPLIGGERVARLPVSPRFGYVPQREALDPLFPFTVRDVVAMGRYRRHPLFSRAGSDDRTAIEGALRRVGMDALASRAYRELSGGQKQRTLIARALASEPEILVLDEPTAGMDLASSRSLLELACVLHREGHLTVVLVTHLLGEVANSARHIVLVKEGRCEVGETDRVLTSENLTRVYGVPVAVDTVAGQRVIVAIDAPEGRQVS